MDNGLVEIGEIEKYVNVIIPNIERGLSDRTKSDNELVELYQLYRNCLRMMAPYDFETFNKWLEIDEDKTQTNRGFYHHRKHHLCELFKALNDMEVYDKYDMLLVSCPPRVGKTTTGIRFLAWITGRHFMNTQLATSYSDAITMSFYIGVSEIVTDDKFKQAFPEAQLVNQNAKREELWLGQMKRYPSITFVPIGGSMTGRAEAGNYLYCDDLVSGIEEALSIVRLEKLYNLYTVNCKQRKKDGCKEIHVATRWSVHDPITKLANSNIDNERCKIISLPCYDEDGESAFNFYGGFSTGYYKELENSMDTLAFDALYRCSPIEREGLLYHPEDMQYYFTLPDEAPSSIIAICDSKNLGVDYVCAPIGYVYGDKVYIEDVVFNNGLPEITNPLVAQKVFENEVVRMDVEANNGGNYYADNLNTNIRSLGGTTSIRTFFSGNNKTVKIVTYSDYIKKNFIFRHPSTYSPNSEYAQFIKDVFSWTQTGKNHHDDSVDGLAMLAQLAQELNYTAVKVLNRRELGL